MRQPPPVVVGWRVAESLLSYTPPLVKHLMQYGGIGMTLTHSSRYQLQPIRHRTEW
jgi:hypothetical protein